ncbi:MAG: hypothetical protein HC905_31785 [Bacteroidales bacterium]|nr:hypothetical protein [Bacteroidales bacterium]
MLFEYLALTFKFSPRIANDELYSSVYLGSYLILFLSGALTGFRIKEGQWAPIRFLGSTISEKLNEIIGCEITITSYSGGKKEDEFLPNQGTIVSRLVVSGEPDWYLVKINKPCEMEYFMRDYILIRAKVKSQPVENGKSRSAALLITTRTANPGLKICIRKKWIFVFIAGCVFLYLKSKQIYFFNNLFMVIANEPPLTGRLASNFPL